MNNNAEQTVYCPFFNTDIPFSESSIEHIIPESAGGSNDFTIRCSDLPPNIWSTCKVVDRTGNLLEEQADAEETIQA